MTCRWRATVALPAILLTLPLPCFGQAWQVDINGTTARYDTGAGAASAAIAPQIEWSAARSLAVLGATVAGMEGSQWSAQGRGEGWLFLLPEPQSRLGASLSAAGTGTFHSSGYRTAATSAEARLLFVGKATGAWIGASGATGWTSSASYPFVSSWGPTAGFWGRAAAWSGSVAVRPFRFQQSWFPEVSGSIALTRGRANFTAFAGWRGAPAGSAVNSLGWGGAAVAVHLAGRVAVTLGAGTYPADFLQAFPRGRYASLGIRVAHRFPAMLREAAALYLPSNRNRAGHELRFAVPGATRVAVAGDWTGWAPVELQPGPNGSWTLRVTLPSGVYRFNLVVDGQRWIVPSEVQAVDDGMGGKTGLLVIPE